MDKGDDPPRTRYSDVNGEPNDNDKARKQSVSRARRRGAVAQLRDRSVSVDALVLVPRAQEPSPPVAKL